MRINAFIATATGLSRRAADQAVAQGRVTINGQTATLGQPVGPGATVSLDGRSLKSKTSSTTIRLNKPVGYVSSRQGQGNQTIYDLLPEQYHRLKPVGRLDKDSSGLLLLTDDGQLANRLTHPRYGKQKTYQLILNKPLSCEDANRIEQGVTLEDGISKLRIKNLKAERCTVVLSEGRNRQIRRTFAALGYTVTGLHRTQFGDYRLGDLHPGSYEAVATSQR